MVIPSAMLRPTPGSTQRSTPWQRGELPRKFKYMSQLDATEMLFKGTGTRDYNRLKVVWYDGSCLGESPANTQKILAVPLILY